MPAEKPSGSGSVPTAKTKETSSAVCPTTQRGPLCAVAVV